MIKRFWNWFIGLFKKTPEYFTRQMPMTKHQFAKMKLFFATKDNAEVEIDRIGDDQYEVWKLVQAYDEFNEPITAAEQVGYYNGETNIYHYTSGFDTLLDNYLKNN